MLIYHILLSMLVVSSLIVEFKMLEYTFLLGTIFFCSMKIEQVNDNKIKVSTHKLFYSVCMTIDFVWFTVKRKNSITIREPL